MANLVEVKSLVDGRIVIVELVVCPVTVTVENMAIGTSQFYMHTDRDRDVKEDTVSINSSISLPDGGLGSGNSSPHSGSGRKSRSPRRKSQGLSFDFLASKTASVVVQKEEKELQNVFNSWTISGIPYPRTELSEFPLPKDDVVENTSSNWQSLVMIEGLSKRQRDQQEAVWELVTTELSYVRSLEAMRLIHMAAFEDLASRQLPSFMLNPKQIFGNLEELLTANTDLWKTCFSPLVHNTNGGLLDATCSSLYNGFMNIGDYLEPYIEFCTTYHHLLAYYNFLSTNNEHFRSVLEFLTKLAVSDRLALSSWMMKPVQRLMRYHILLGTIAKKTDDPYQRSRLQDMINSAENFVHHINAKVKDAEDAEALNRVYDRIYGYSVFDNVTEEVSQLLTQYSHVEIHKHSRRKFIREFDVKVKRVDEPFKRTDSTLLIFSDVVMLCRKSGKKSVTTRVKIFRALIPLRQIRVHPLRETASFLLVILDDLNTVGDAHVIYAKNPAQMESLNTCILKAVEDLENSATKVTINRQPEKLQLKLSGGNDLSMANSPVPDGSPESVTEAENGEETSTDPDPTPRLPAISLPTCADLSEDLLSRPHLFRSRSWSSNDIDQTAPPTLLPPDGPSRRSSVNIPFVEPDNEFGQPDHDSADTTSLEEDSMKPENSEMADLNEKFSVAAIIREISIEEPVISDLDETASQTTDAGDLHTVSYPSPERPPTPPSARRGIVARMLSSKTPLSHVNSHGLVLKRQNGFRNVKRNINKLKRHLTDTVTPGTYEESPLTVSYPVHRASSYSDADLQTDDTKSSPSISNGSSAYSLATPNDSSQENLGVQFEEDLNSSYEVLINSDEPRGESALDTYYSSMNRDYKSSDYVYVLALDVEDGCEIGETDVDSLELTDGFLGTSIVCLDEKIFSSHVGDEKDEERKDLEQLISWNNFNEKCNGIKSDQCDAYAKILLMASPDSEETYI